MKKTCPYGGVCRTAPSDGRLGKKNAPVSTFQSLKTRMDANMIQTRSHSLLGLMSPCFRAAFGFLLLGCLMAGAVTKLTAAETVVAPDTAAFPSATNPAVFIQSNTVPHFSVIGYTVEGDPLLSTNVLVAIFSKYSGTNVSLASIAKAAADLQSEYFHQGYTNMSVAIDRNQIINGIVTMNVFQTVIPQIVVSGIRYISSTNNGEVDWNPLIAESTTGPIFLAASTATTNAIPAAAKAIPPVIHLQATPANPEEMAQARAALFQGMADAAAREKDTRVHVVSTNTGPRFDVEKYLIQGNTVLPPLVLGEVLTNIDGVYGTNVSFDGVRAVLAELQGAYRERGYVTVGVGLPQQKLTNATVKVAVTEGRLANINVTGNHYFSSNNVMRALPSLHTYLILNSLVFGAELNRANANQDRQIYPVIGPGPEPGTSDLTLKVKDRLPLHAKVELNNESSPGTPDLRINASAMEANLWQLEHSLGVQYSFSPGSYKRDTQPWNFYDEPLVANYSAFYRLPLGNPQSIEDVVVNNPGSFGYSEATRQFRLPPPTGRTDLNVYASRSTVDTGLLTPLSESVADIPGFLSISRQDVQEQITVNNDIGSRLSTPAIATTDFQSGFSGGLDYKTYNLTSYKTNTFFFTITTVNPDTGQKTTTKSTVASPAPTPVQEVQYLPLALSYDGAYHNPDVTVGFGLGSQRQSVVFGFFQQSPDHHRLQGILGLLGQAEPQSGGGYCRLYQLALVCACQWPVGQRTLDQHGAIWRRRREQRPGLP